MPSILQMLATHLVTGFKTKHFIEVKLLGAVIVDDIQTVRYSADGNEKHCGDV
jgi:hypothetical protein